jgi:protein TonB
MALRCLLFSSDKGTATPILQVLADLGVEGEHCSEPVATIEKATHQSFQIVIIDWDQQPEAGLLLMAARDRKAAERPLTLAIVSNEVSVPQALQAGANSILRKPIIASQVRDTLTTARDLLRSKQDSATAAAAGASAGSVSTIPHSVERGNDEKTLRAGEFLQSPGTAPGRQFVTDSEHESLEPFSVEPVDPLKDLEPMAASVGQETAAPPPPSAPPAPPGEFRGLEWYLKTRTRTSTPNPAPASPPPADAKPALVGFDPTPSSSSTPSTTSQDRSRIPETKSNQRPPWEQKPELFAHIAGETPDSGNEPRPRSRLRGAIVGALLLAACAILSAPRAPWHPQVRAVWAHGHRTLHGWLNPQPVTPVQAPVTHEDFGRAGDEYKLPVPENIPDATTDPSQIHVLPVVDPTVKKPNSLGGNAEPPAQADPTGATPTDQAPTSTAPLFTPETAQPVAGPPAGATSASPGSTPASLAAPVVPLAVPLHADPPAVALPSASVSYTPGQPAPPKNPQPHARSTPGSVPSSLKSQMASQTPDAGGNKAPESALPSIEPVVVSEATERALLTDQPPLDYPASARGQQGTVILQVLIGRDGAVKDAKFMQGSLAFARAAIDGVKLWKFKPYTMNGRPVSVQSLLTVNFKP